MPNQSLNDMVMHMGKIMGMSIQKDDTAYCGTYLQGNGTTTKGFLWFFSHEEKFVISRCDFVFCENCELEMPQNSKYISLRLDAASHLPPGKIVSFMEENGGSVHTEMKQDTRVAYTEILYAPSFYGNRLSSFSSLKEDPIQILKNMGGDHNWPTEMLSILTDVQKCSMFGAAAELFYIAKAYELMATLVKMGNTRAPRNADDYDSILSVINYIDDHLERKLDQQTLVHISNMSPTKLKSLFKHFTGQTITEYILEKRADKASHLLSETDWSIEAISKAIGFETATGFSTSYKKHVGISPTEYRKRMKFHCTKNVAQAEKIVF